MGSVLTDNGAAAPVFRTACPHDAECSGLYRQLPTASLVLTADLSIAAATKDYLQATMAAEGDLIGRPVFDAFPANPNDPADLGPRELAASFERVQRTGTRDRMGLVRYDIPTRDGGFELRHWLPVNAPIFDAEGKLQWIVHQVEDVSEYARLKHAACDRQRAEERLWQDVHALDAEIGQSVLAMRREMEILVEANEAKTQLLSAVSHDLRQPVQAAALFTSCLQTLSLPEEATRRIRFIEISLKAMDRMLSDLLDLSRLEAGKMVPHVVRFGLAPLLERLADEFRPLVEAEGLAFKFSGSPYAASSDPVLLEQILRNLIANAIKYTAKGGVALRCRKLGREIQISVCDTGIGIPPDQTERIFDDYYQIRSGGGNAGGLGLGLATVARAAKLLGHGLKVRSKPGRGSIFSIHLASAET